MDNQAHPFHAVAALASARGMDNLRLKVERDGAYLRLVQNAPPIFFKYGPDPGDNIDRIGLDHFKRLTLSEDDCAAGPEATLALIARLLEKFADYESQRPLTKPKSGRQ